MYRILLVDDKEVFLRIIKRMPFFEKNARTVQITWATNSANKALSVLRQENVDIVLTDIRMPFMSGIDLLKVIQQEKLCPCTILMSEYTEFAYAREGILHGAFDYIVKPLEETAFETAMNRAVSYLEKLDSMRGEDAVSAETLIKMLLHNDREEFEQRLNDLEANGFSGLEPAEILKTIQNVRRQLLQSLSIDYPYLERFLPLESLLSAPDSGEEDAASAVAHLKESLLFLQRKFTLFHTVSGNRQVQNIWYYTIINSDGPCRLSDTACRFFLNTSYLSSLFRKETGISYKSFVQDLKMERAKNLLGFSDLRISEIASQLSFTDAEYFRKSFKSSVGISPAKFDYQEYIRTTIEK